MGKSHEGLFREKKGILLWFFFNVVYRNWNPSVKITRPLSGLGR
jgi:hypothetical protein